MHWDPSYYTLKSMQVARQIAASPLQGLINTAVYDYSYYPPGYFITNSAALLLFGYKISNIIAWQIIYLLITLILIYKTSITYSNKALAALAALMFLCFPIVLGLGRMTYIENLLAAQLMSFIYLYLKDSEMKSYIIAFLCGLIAGYGQLTKWQFIIFIAPLVIINLTRQIKTLYTNTTSQAYSKKLFYWLLLAFITFSSIAMPWYYINFEHIINHVHYNAFIKVLGSKPCYYPSSIFYYLQSLPWQMIGLPISLVIIIAMFATIKNSNIHHSIKDLTFSFLLSIIIMTFITHKQGRFIMPLLVICPIVIAAWISKQNKLASQTAIIFILFFSAVNATTQTLNLSSSIPEFSLPIGFGRNAYIIRYGTPDWILPPISKSNWRLDEIFNIIIKKSKLKNISPLVYWHIENGEPYYNESTLSSCAAEYAQKAKDEIEANFYIYRFPSAESISTTHTQIRENLSLIDKWTLPDGAEVMLYQKKKP